MTEILFRTQKFSPMNYTCVCVCVCSVHDSEGRLGELYHLPHFYRNRYKLRVVLGFGHY
jgi:hypothetical protein